MTEKRSYKLLCPIARALDAIGDRWALLILRDLHAGPARFQELQGGLGIATNLLSSRLSELTAAGIIQKAKNSGRSAYELTELGHRSDMVLWELAKFGSMLDPDPEPRKPGNLRTMVLPLRITLGSVQNRPDLVVRLLIDDDIFTITSSSAGVEVEYGDTDAAPQLTVRADYVAFLEVGEGRLRPDDFAKDHLEVIDGGEHAPAFLSLLAAAMTESNATS